jgi:hypothetical protein
MLPPLPRREGEALAVAAERREEGHRALLLLGATGVAPTLPVKGEPRPLFVGGIF